MSRPTKDLAGQTFNSWHVIEFSHKGPTNKAHWRCRCSCGAEKVIESYNLTSGRSKSCRPCSAQVVADNTHMTHGLSDSREYRAWQAMKTRCLNPNAVKAYKYHGALGVKVHPEWVDDFLSFLACIGPAPTDLHTVDRIDSFGNYEPGNVKWSTQTEQMQNTRRAAKYQK
jgi:hypothetical protein